MFSRTLTFFLTVSILAVTLYIIFAAELSKLYYNNLFTLSIDSYRNLFIENTSIFLQNDQSYVQVMKQEKIILKNARTVFTTNIQNLREKKPNNISFQPDSRLTCLDGVVTLIPGGRLANKIFEYVSACFLAHSINYRCSVPKETVLGLQNVFTNLSASVLENEVNSGRCKGQNLTVEFVMNNGPENPIDFEQYYLWAKESKQPIILWRWVNLIDLIIPNFESAQKLLQTRPDIESRAANVFVNISKVLRNKYIKHEIIFIGIHVRRTDMIKYLKRKYNVKVAGVEYYRHAVADMREHFHKNESSIIAFILASDDLQWCKDYLIPILNKDLQRGQPSAEIFLADDGNYKSPAHDLTTLSMCNHSIISYGTFGMWAAMKAGGRTIVYDVMNPKNRNAKSAFTYKVLKYFKDWKVIS